MTIIYKLLNIYCKNNKQNVKLNLLKIITPHPCIPYPYLLHIPLIPLLLYSYLTTITSPTFTPLPFPLHLPLLPLPHTLISLPLPS